MPLGRTAAPEEGGFALIEVIIAIALLLVVLVPSTQLIETTVQQSIMTRDRVAALEMAEQGLEQISNDSITTLEADLNTELGAQHRHPRRGDLHSHGLPHVAGGRQ